MATKGRPRPTSTEAPPVQDDIGVEARVVAGILLNAALEKRNGLDEALSQPPRPRPGAGGPRLRPRRGHGRLAPSGRDQTRSWIAACRSRRLRRCAPCCASALAQTLVLETPAFAAVSTAVKLAERDPKTRPYKNLVNAVLRGVGRDGPGLTTAESNLPDWIAARWKAAYGEAALVGLALAARE